MGAGMIIEYLDFIVGTGAGGPIVVILAMFVCVAVCVGGAMVFGIAVDHFTNRRSGGQ